MKGLLATITFFVCLKAVSQNIQPDLTALTNNPDSFVIPPKLHRGDEEWLRFVVRNINLSVLQANNAPVGRYTVIVSFVVNAKGNVVIEKDPGFGTGDDVKRALKECPRWIPATRNGVKIPYRIEKSIVYVRKE